MKPMTIRNSIPEVNSNQWNYLYALLVDQLDLSSAQEARLAELLQVNR